MWNPEGSAGTYDVYRGRIDTIAASYGSCRAGDLPAPTFPRPKSPISTAESSRKAIEGLPSGRGPIRVLLTPR